MLLRRTCISSFAAIAGALLRHGYYLVVEPDSLRSLSDYEALHIVGHVALDNNSITATAANEDLPSSRQNSAHLVDTTNEAIWKHFRALADVSWPATKEMASTACVRAADGSCTALQQEHKTLRCGKFRQIKDDPEEILRSVKKEFHTFFLAKVPPMEIDEFATVILPQLHISEEVLMIALVFLARMIDIAKIPLTVRSAHRMLIGALIVAAKAHHDRPVPFSQFAQHCELPVAVLARLEAATLQALDFSCFVHPCEYVAMVYSMRTCFAQLPHLRKAGVSWTHAVALLPRPQLPEEREPPQLSPSVETISMDSPTIAVSSPPKKTAISILEETPPIVNLGADCEGSPLGRSLSSHKFALAGSLRTPKRLTEDRSPRNSQSRGNGSAMSSSFGSPKNFGLSSGSSPLVPSALQEPLDPIVK